MICISVGLNLRNSFIVHHMNGSLHIIENSNYSALDLGDFNAGIYILVALMTEMLSNGLIYLVKMFKLVYEI